MAKRRCGIKLFIPDDKEKYMLGYKIKIPESLPKILWACKAHVDRYNWQNNNKSNMIEFSLSNAKRRTLVDVKHNFTETLEGRRFCCLVGDDEWKSYAEDGVVVEVVSVAVAFDELSYSVKELELEDACDESCILLPRILVDGVTERFENILYRIVEQYKENSAMTALACGTAVLTLMLELDAMTRKSIRVKKNKYVHYYVDKAESIINKRFAEKLTLRGVAEELGITPNYLSAIFKSAKGVGFTDRLLEIRMRKAEALINGGELSDGEISASLGFEEIGHFRRRFKQYFGVSIRDWRCISKELTLYHDKPQRKEEVES